MMANQVSDSSVAAEDKRSPGARWFLAGYFFGGLSYIEECGPVSDREFKLLMAFVALATFTFGCVVHGWLL